MEIINFKEFTNEKRRCAMSEILKTLKGLTAEELLKKYDMDTIPPIDILTLSNKIGISVQAMDFLPIESEFNLASGDIIGATVSNEENLSIFYRMDSTKNRERFTIAHELAHCCLHSGDLEDYHIELRSAGTALDVKEYNANIFAGELLIPENYLRKVYSTLLNKTPDILASIFNVSKSVMEERLRYLDMIPEKEESHE